MATTGMHNLEWRTVRIAFLSMTNIPSIVNPIGSPLSRLRNTLTLCSARTDLRYNYNDRIFLEALFKLSTTQRFAKRNVFFKILKLTTCKCS